MNQKTSVNVKPMHALYTGIFLVLSVILGWFGVLEFGFVWDDISTVMHNQSLQNWSTLWRGFAYDFWALHDEAAVSGYYRPWVTVVYVLWTKLIGAGAASYHALNLVWVVGIVLLFAYAALRSGLPWTLVSALGLLLAFHPIVIEPTVFISALPDLCVVFFSLLAMIMVVERKAWGWGFLAALMALLSKESAVSLLFLLGAFAGVQRVRLGYRLAGLAMVAMTYLTLRGLAGVWPSPGLEQHLGGLARAALVLESLCRPFRSIVWPYPLTPIHDIPVPQAFTWEHAAVLIVVVASLVGLYRYRHQRWVRIVSPILLVSLILWLPYLHIIPIEGLYADRYVYPIWVAVITMIALALGRLNVSGKQVGVLTVIFGGLGVIAFLWTANVREAWASSRDLWEHALKYAPHSPIALNELGNEWARDGRWDQALSYYDRALAQRPEYKDAALNRIASLLHLSREPEAHRALQVYRSHASCDARCLLLSSTLALKVNDHPEALAQAHQAYRASGGAPRYVYHLALTLYALGRWTESESVFQQLQESPHYRAEAQFYLAQIEKIKQL